MSGIIACGNLKGGVGKTTIAVNLACALAARGHEAVLLDLDPQGGAAAWATAGEMPVQVEAAPALDAAGSGRWPGRAGELVGARHLVVLDLPPFQIPSLAAALMIADAVLVPITPSALDLAGTRQTLRMVEATRATRPQRRPMTLLVPNRIAVAPDESVPIETPLPEVAGHRAPSIRQHTDFVAAVRAGAWIGRHAAGSPAAQDVEALADAVRLLLDLQPPGAAPFRSTAFDTSLTVSA